MDRWSRPWTSSSQKKSGVLRVKSTSSDGTSIQPRLSRRFRKKTRNSMSGRTAFCHRGEKGTEAEGQGRAVVEESREAEGRFSGEKFSITLSSGRMSVISAEVG